MKNSKKMVNFIILVAIYELVVVFISFLYPESSFFIFDILLFLIMIFLYVVEFKKDPKHLKYTPGNLLLLPVFMPVFLVLDNEISMVLRVIIAYMILVKFSLPFLTRKFTAISSVLVFASIVFSFGTLIMVLAEGRNILDAMWWAAVTMTTVGYGDIVPGTVIGRTASMFVILGGIVVTAILTAIMVDRMNRRYRLKRFEEYELTNYLTKHINQVKKNDLDLALEILNNKKAQMDNEELDETSNHKSL